MCNSFSWCFCLGKKCERRSLFQILQRMCRRVMVSKNIGTLRHVKEFELHSQKLNLDLTLLDVVIQGLCVKIKVWWREGGILSRHSHLPSFSVLDRTNHSLTCILSFSIPVKIGAPVEKKHIQKYALIAFYCNRTSASEQAFHRKWKCCWTSIN